MSTNKSVSTSRDKVYTSYFDEACKIFPDKRLVSISITSAEKFNGSYARELRPSKELLWAYKGGEITDEEYIEWYTETILDNLDPNEIYERYKGKVLCCWEKSECFCHRHIILDWLQKELGDWAVGREI